MRPFGYDFDGFDMEKSKIKNYIPESQKKNINYHWNDDILLIDDERV